jgi:molecular chaperone GrpE
VSSNLDQQASAKEGAADSVEIQQSVQNELVTDPTSHLAALESERDALVAEKADLLERLLRRQAEFENFRKRMERERQEFAEYAASEAVRAVLPVLDDFERALKVETADKEYAKGMELIHGRLSDALMKLGLEPIEAKGRKFDPNLHHAIERVSDPEAEDETVLEEYQRGYNFKGRLLRPAMVRVAVK